jgi:hypothetical protein
MNASPGAVWQFRQSGTGEAMSRIPLSIRPVRVHGQMVVFLHSPGRTFQPLGMHYREVLQHYFVETYCAVSVSSLSVLLQDLDWSLWIPSREE